VVVPWGSDGEPSEMHPLMSAKERDRLRAVDQLSKSEGKSGELTQAQAAKLLGCSERQVRRLVQRYRQDGDAGLVHRLRGKPSNRRLSEELRHKAIELVRQHYVGFGPTLAAEKLGELHDLRVSRETLRGWMAEGKLWSPKPRKATHRQWRERKACFGEMVLLDAAEFEHHAIVTNLHWRARAVWVLYNHRATIETVLCEGALGFHMDSLPSASFTGNQTYIQLLMPAYNLVNLFRRLRLPRQHSRHHVTTLRHLLLALPALLERTADGVLLHSAGHGPPVKLLPFITDRIRRWLLTPGSGPPTPQPT